MDFSKKRNKNLASFLFLSFPSFLLLRNNIHQRETRSYECYDIFMASSTTSPNIAPPALSAPVREAFEAAKREFYQNLKNPASYNLSKFTSINDVYDTTQKIQDEQSRTGSMRHLNRIKPYLEGLTQFIGVLDTFSQVKADISSLIWVSFAPFFSESRENIKRLADDIRLRSSFCFR